MHSFRITLALLSALAVPAAAHASTFNFTATGSGGGFSGSGMLAATANGGGSYTISGISGTGITGIIPPGNFDGNDNLLFPASTTLVDTHGFAFSDTQSNTGFKVDIFSTGTPGAYEAYFLDSDGFSNHVPVTFSVASSPVPEPSSLLLLGTGLAGFAGVLRRRLFA